jgi:hypothetical protein
VNRRWPDEAVQFGESVTAALDRLGAVELARRVEADPTLRVTELKPVLERLGFFDIDVLGNQANALAAAAAARAAGAVVAPWPVAAQLAAPVAAGSPAAVYPSLGLPTRLEHLDLFADAIAVDLRPGRSHPIRPGGGVEAMPLDPFGVAAEPTGDGPDLTDPGQRERALHAHIVLAAYYVLGALEAVVDMTAAYARERRQFGRPIAEFGAIQWRLSDIVVSRDGLAELAGDTLWRFCAAIVTPSDVLGLRLAMIEAAQVILANSHQVFGSIGLCEEHDLAVMDRHLQAFIRRPCGAVGTSEVLCDQILAHGYDAIYPIAGAA